MYIFVCLIILCCFYNMGVFVFLKKEKTKKQSNKFLKIEK